MADPQENYLTIERLEASYRPICERIGDFNPVKASLSMEQAVLQSRRCQDCGVPFCHLHGCPLGNRVPDYSDAVAQGHWKEALRILHASNNFPDFTGRICPALCEASCTLAVNFQANACQGIELGIVEKGWNEGWIVPQRPLKTSGKRVAVVGSGPAGLTIAQQLARCGHETVVFEKSRRIGGLLRYGIPNFKLEKTVLDRRLAQLVAEGVRFETEVEIGSDLSSRYLLRTFDAVVLAPGTPLARDLDVEGRALKGVHLALEFLSQQIELSSGDAVKPSSVVDPRGKRVVVIGGGDTGSDCVGTAIRRGCASVTQIELLPRPPLTRSEDNPWPQWPRIMRTSSSHEEGVERLWSIGTQRILGENGQVRALSCVKLAWENGRPIPIEGSQFIIEAELVLLSMGFVPYRDSPLVREFGLALDPKGNILVDDEHRCSVDKVFACGDAVSGASLVVHAIAEGRKCARSVHAFLTNAGGRSASNRSKS